MRSFDAALGWEGVKFLGLGPGRERLRSCYQSPPPHLTLLQSSAVGGASWEVPPSAPQEDGRLEASLLQYSCLKNSTNRGAWQPMAHGVAKNWAQLSDYAKDPGSIPGLGRSPGVGKWQLTPVFLPGKFNGQGILEAYSPWGPGSLSLAFS